MRAYHFCSAHYAQTNIEKRRLKASTYPDLNDPYELLGATAQCEADRAAIGRNAGRIGELFGLLCFSRDWINPVIWAHYSDKHRGIALGFDVSDEMIRAVDYISKPIIFESDAIAGHVVADAAKTDNVLYSKFNGWEYEHEWRMPVRLDKDAKIDGMHFVNFLDDLKMTEVILGARCTVTACRGAKVRGVTSVPSVGASGATGS